MVRLWVTIFFLFAGAVSGWAEPALARVAPNDCGQVLLVVTKDWKAPTGTLRRFSRGAKGWRAVDRQPIPVTVGRKGLGWGRGLHQVTAKGPTKAEGDRRAPAGIFQLGTGFGYDAAPRGMRWQYRKATANDFFVDDPKSQHYNQWVRQGPNAGVPPWKSAERMRRADSLYTLGLVVRHNMDPVKPGAGSAIFLHLWSKPGNPTIGCTAMAKPHMADVLKWLDPRARPVLVQIPMAALPSLRLRK